MSILRERMPGPASRLPHWRLGHAPTPVRRLEGIAGGPAGVWLKDESVFGDGGWGGNKVRKLEWLLPDAVRRGRRSILTFGGLGTNWGLATALYGRELGLEVALALVDQPRDRRVEAQLQRLRLSGAALHFTRTRARTVAALPALVARHTRGGRPPLVLPPGGSSPLGVLGYVEVALELAAQVDAGELPEPERVIVPVGSGGTAAGLLLGLGMAGLSSRVLGVIVSDQPRLDPAGLAGRARAAARLLRKRGYPARIPEPDPGRMDVVRDWLGAGYGHPTADSERAVTDAAATGLTLDPVYTGKAMAALRTMNEGDSLGAGPVLFVNTNGPR